MQRENETDIEINRKSNSDSTSGNLEARPVVEETDSKVDACSNSELNRSMLEGNQRFFYDRLSECHESAGLSLIGSYAKTVLDLFRLYAEVTNRGGFEKVTRDGRWSEIASALDFTNASNRPSFLLKDLYGNLLSQYELIYFWGIQENPSGSPGSILAPSPSQRTSVDHPSDIFEAAKKKHQNTPCQSSEASFDPGTQVGHKVLRVVETDFDCDYLAKVTVGSENLNGVLYQHENSSLEQFARVPSLMDGVGLEGLDSEPVDLQVRVGSVKQVPKVASSSNNETKNKPNVDSALKKNNVTKEKEARKRNVESKSKKENVGAALKKNNVKKEQEGRSNTESKPKKEVKKDQGAPQRPRSAYQFFMCKECDRIKKTHKNVRNVRQLVIDAWKGLSESDRQPYIEESQMDRARYDQEIVAYKRRKNMEGPNVESKIPKSETSFHDFNNGYHVKLQMEETDLLKPSGPMSDFTIEMMENARKLDASMQIQLEDDFLSVP